jgi:hypothetical protein
MATSASSVDAEGTTPLPTRVLVTYGIHWGIAAAFERKGMELTVRNNARQAEIINAHREAVGDDVYEKHGLYKNQGGHVRGESGERAKMVNGHSPAQQLFAVEDICCTGAEMSECLELCGYVHVDTQVLKIAGAETDADGEPTRWTYSLRYVYELTGEPWHWPTDDALELGSNITDDPHRTTWVHANPDGTVGVTFVYSLNDRNEAKVKEYLDLVVYIKEGALKWGTKKAVFEEEKPEAPSEPVVEEESEEEAASRYN